MKHRQGHAKAGYIVWDSRDGHVMPALAIGDEPEDCFYSERDARHVAEMLNRSVLRDVVPGLIEDFSRVSSGPFYVYPVSARSKLENIPGSRN